MARESNHKVAVTPTEFDWVQKTISKRAGLVKPKTKVAEEKQLVALAEKLSEPSEVLNLNRQQARIVQKILKATVQSLMSVIIPGYVEKGKQDYADAAAEKMRSLQMLLMKVEKVL